ncbi:hypothetical protein [Dysosmobacter sp.]|uniref:hypothetical protein n=1 Tax=Dysosmobacter sp. TaxID=2591382 RepID=UPI002A89B852|nr:hypothetical protein [Dysosmobacter sp.]MDY3282639.1 hypothetical protein [Dysosmobacter sp.]
MVILTVVIAAALTGAAYGACRLVRPPERGELTEVSGSFSRMEVTTTNTHYADHCRWWIYLEGTDGGYCVDQDTGFPGDAFPAQAGDTVTLLCTAEEPPSDVYGIRADGEEILSYEQAARGTRVHACLRFGGCALLLALCWLGWLGSHRYTTEKPALYRSYRGRRRFR